VLPTPVSFAQACAPGQTLIAPGLGLRPLHDTDLGWLGALYASTRAEEMAPVPWPDATKKQFLDQQFQLQQRHYLSHYADASFWAIENRHQHPIGSYYLLRTAPAHLIIHIGLLPDMRGQGLGSTLIRHSQTEAAALGRGMRLQVHQSNHRARKLYQQLGFVTEAEQGMHLAMRWAP
jgi:ribosomal protein S18 acetylase RimI-like enzyme